LALTSPTSGGRSVGIIRSRTRATEYFYTTEIEITEVDLPNDAFADNAIFNPSSLGAQ
jgi:hypothetical protein